MQKLRRKQGEPRGRTICWANRCKASASSLFAFLASGTLFFGRVIGPAVNRSDTLHKELIGAARACHGSRAYGIGNASAAEMRILVSSCGTWLNSERRRIPSS